MSTSLAVRPRARLTPVTRMVYAPRPRARVTYVTRTRHRSKKRFSIFTLMGLGISPFVGDKLHSSSFESIKAASEGRWAWSDAAADIISNYLGYEIRDWSKKWTLPPATMAIVLGALGHKVAQASGVNRAFSQMPSPMNKICL